MADNVTPFDRERRLADIIRQVKIATAEREDAAVEIREADQARLELVAEALGGVIEAVPDDAELFDFAISAGSQPRLWIDAVAHVHMARDQRTYRLVRDTRLGRTVLAETDTVAGAADAVSRYVAERLIERERALAGERKALPEPAMGRVAGERHAGEDGHAAADDLPAIEASAAGQGPSRFSVALLWFVLGCVVGAAGLYLFLTGTLPGLNI